MRLRPILQSRLEEMEIDAIRTMAAHAMEFCPMWMTKTRAEMALEALKSFL